MATITVDRSINADDAFAMSGGIAFVALPSGSATYQTQATGIATWVTATIVSSSNWQSVCYGNNLVVAVSSTSGTIAASSPAGVTATWTLRTMPATASWYAVAYGLSKFVAVSGGASTAGAYSADGAKWTSTGALTTSGDWRALAFGDDRFVALSYNSTNSNYSTNGTSWTAGGALPGTRNWTSIVYGEGTFVAVASGSSSGAYSTDGGVTWNNTTMPSAASWSSVTYGNGTFVAVATGPSTAAAYSADGITWSSSTLPASRSWVGVAFGNNLFSAVASGSTTGGAYSYNGINWVANTTLSQTVSCICHTPTTWNSNDTLVITNNSTVTVNTDQGKFWNAVTLTNGKLAITNNSTSTGIRFTMGRVSGAAAAVITPGSGIGDIEITGNWIELGTGSGSSGQTMTAPFSDYIAALWVETGSGTGVYEQWLNATGSYGDASPILLEGLAAVGSGRRGKFFVQQANAAPYGPTIINGTDGSIAQKLITVTSTTGLYAGAAILGPGIPANTVVNRVISSTLLETNAISTTELSPDWSGVAFGNSTYVAISRTSSNIAATSSDGVTWTKRTLPFVANWNGICYGATSALFVAVCSDITTTGGTQIGSRFCATSADGITWTRRAMPANQSWNAVATNGTSFVAVGAAADGTATTGAASSTDGLTWVAATMATSLIWQAVGYGGSRYVAVGGATATVCNYDADGAGTWTAGATMTSGNYVAIAYSASRWVAVTATTASQYKDDPTTGAFTVGGTLTTGVARGIAWDGTNFVVVSTTNSVTTHRSTNGVSWTSTTNGATYANNWMAICANGTTLCAVSSSSTLRSAAMTSTDSGATWTLRTGIPLDVSLTCYNPYVSQLTNTVEFGDNINGNKVPTGAKVRCPNIMFTSAVPVNIQTASSIVGANMVMTNAGSLTASICLFDESYNTFTQPEIVSLTNCAFSIPPIINECYNLTFNSVGFALAPVRRYYTYSATIGADGWFTRDGRYAATVTWTYLNGASITDFNYCVGAPKALQVAVSTVTNPAVMLNLSYTQDSTWSYVRFYALNCVASFQDAFNFSANFNDNTMEHLELYGVAPMLLQVSNNNTITDIRIAEDMFNGYRSFPTSGARIGNDPNASAGLLDDTKYYLKARTFYDWNDRSIFAEGRTVSATPYIGSQFSPAFFGAYNNATRSVTLTWIRRDPSASGAAGSTIYQIFRDTTPGFTPSSTNMVFDTLTVGTVSYVNGFIATITATASPVRTITFAQAGRTITLSGAGAGSFTTAGFVAGGNVVVAGTASNNGTYTILSFTATVITLTTNHTNLVNETAPNGTTLNGQPPVNGTSYYYKLRKHDATLAGITSASGTVALTSLTTAGNFNTGLGSIINLEGISGQFKIRIPVGSTTNFLAGNVFPGLTLAGTGIGSGAKVVSLDTPWQITVDVANSSTFVGTTATLGLATGVAPNSNIYVTGPGIARPTRVSSVTNSTTIVVDTAFINTFSAQAIFFEYGNDSAEVEVTPSGPTTAAFNFLTRSNDFTHANWVKTNLTATADAVSGPNDIGFGIAAVPTADRLLSTGPSARAVQTITSYLEIGASYTFSVFIRTDAHHYAQTVTGELSINTTVVTTEAFTATGVWQRISADFTATAVTHTFTIQMTTEGSYIYASSALVNQGTTALVPITTTTVKSAVASGGRTFTFASGIDGLNTITGSTGSFITDGFVIGDSIIVQSTSDNDGTYVISSTAITATVITVVAAQPFTNGGGAQTTGSIVGSVLASAAQELSAAYAWCRAAGGNTENQGIEVAFAALPTGSFWTELYIGTTSGFAPSSVNRVGYTLNLLGASTSFYLLNSNNNLFNTLVQEGVGGFSGTRAFLRGSAGNSFLDWTIDYNYGAVPMIGDIASLSNDNVFDDFTVKNFRNYNLTPFTTLNDSSGLTLQNITIEQANDIPYALQTQNTTLKGVTGAHAFAATNATTYLHGTAPFATDGMAIAYQAVYDNIFYELFHSETTGALHMLFNASSLDTPPYSIVSGTPAFGNNGRLYLRTAGDSIEYTWPHRIYTVSSFRDVILKKNGLDLGSSLDVLQSLLVEFSIDTGTGDTYSAYATATPANLAATVVDTVTGFLLKIKITARPGMLFSTQTNAFIATEVIRGASSGATATVDEVFNLTTTTGTIVVSGVSGTFFPGELIVRDSDSATRATNVVTNTQFALFPSFNSYIDGLQIFTNTVGPGDYPGRTANIVLTNVVTGSTYYVFKTSDATLLGSGTASGSTVTIANVAYVSDFGITVRVRKGSNNITFTYASESSGPFVVGNAITSSAGGTGYIASLVDGGSTGTLVIRNVVGTFANTNTLTSGLTTATIDSVPATVVTTKYIPLETQATVTSSGASVYIGQLEDTIVGASVNGTIAGDFTVNTTTKTIKHTADAVVYTINELYTWLMDYFDDVTTIDDTVPISAQTPTEYTLTNGWFMDNVSFKYLSGGAIQTDGQDAYSTHILTVTGGTYADPIAGDITKTVMAGATAIGPLLDYEIISAGVSSKWYVRDTRVTPAQIASTTAMTITTGTGSGNNSVNSLTGENIWANIFTLGTIVSGTTLDVYQNDSQITPWWSAGQIDVLVKVREAGTEIDSGNVTVLARKYSTLYDHYVVDASTGRNPVPLAAFTDTNNQVIEATVGAYAGITFDFGAASKDLGNGNGAQPYDCVVECNSLTIQEVYEYLKYVTRTGSGTTLNGVNGEYYQAVGDIRLNYTGEASGPLVEGNAITSSAGGTGYIVSLIDGGATGTLVIRNVHGTFADTNTLTSSGTTATISGAPVTILQSKQAPFGVFSGGKLFGARGVWLENVAAADSINYQLIDSLGVTQAPPISVTVTVRDANTLVAVDSARVLLEAAAGGDLPAGASITITRSGATASVAHTTHNMTTGMSVIIRGAAQDEYNGVFTISNVTTNAYDYTVSGSPATPATGTITATCAILNGVTNVSGIFQTTTFNYTSDQPITGKVRKATAGVKYKTGAITGTITSTGLNTTVLLITDE